MSFLNFEFKKPLCQSFQKEWKGKVQTKSLRVMPPIFIVLFWCPEVII